MRRCVFDDDPRTPWTGLSARCLCGSTTRKRDPWERCVAAPPTDNQRILSNRPRRLPSCAGDCLLWIVPQVCGVRSGAGIQAGRGASCGHVVRTGKAWNCSDSVCWRRGPETRWLQYICFTCEARKDAAHLVLFLLLAVPNTLTPTSLPEPRKEPLQDPGSNRYPRVFPNKSWPFDMYLAPQLGVALGCSVPKVKLRLGQ
ncbi:hypothetical protein BC567DRAFT_218251 [Phyllosticta citribraziliensis]